MSEIIRESTGRFVKGAPSPNPSGKPKAPEAFKQIFKENAETALRVIVEILENPKSDTKDRLRAAECILSYTCPKATTTQHIEIEDYTQKVENMAPEDRESKIIELLQKRAV
jgi:hypothetical protein